LKKTAIIGAGITGLAAASALSEKNHEVTVYDKNSMPGGLCRHFEFEGETVENYYHYYLPYDKKLIEFTDKRNIRIIWKKIKLGFFYKKNIYDYNSIFEMINFKPLSLINRIRNIGGTALLLYLIKAGLFKHNSAVNSLKILIGKKNYDILWKDLLQKKFHCFSDSLTLDWLIYRIIRVSMNQSVFVNSYTYGYFKNQVSEITNTLLTDLKKNNCSLIFNKEIKTINTINGKLEIDGKSYDSVISTIPLNSVSKILHSVSPEFSSKLSSVKYLDLITPVFIVKKKITDYFWLNVVDDDFIYPGIIEFTNINSEMWKNKNYSLLYFPFYLTKNMEKMSDEYYITKAIEILRQVNQNFEPDDILQTFCFRDINTQAISDADFYKLNLSFKTPVKNFYIADSALFQPDDRSISECISLAEKITSVILKEEL